MWEPILACWTVVFTAYVYPCLARTDLNDCFESQSSYLAFVIEAMIGKSETCVATIIGIGIEGILGRSEYSVLKLSQKVVRRPLSVSVARGRV